MNTEYLDEQITRVTTIGDPVQPDDAFNPHADGVSDLNQHGTDMLAEPDVTQDPYATRSTA